ncbi:glycoside hydrolase superfamily [Pilaira anomala]|nr:glycoside hydrolase superfamily [Pilaira anomala]
MQLFILSLTIAIVSPSIAWATLLWPAPQSFVKGEVELNLDTTFHIDAPEAKHLQEAIDRYTHLITHERWTPVQVPLTQSTNVTVSGRTLASLDIKIKYKDIPLGFDVDESYTLEIPVNTRKATLRSNTVWGSIRGLETFSQLVQSRPERNDQGELIYYEEDQEIDSDNYGFEGLFIPNAPIKIKDYPKYPHRGLMLDTSRNFYPVFHWHLTDSHSFPLKLDTVPELAREGAYKLHQKRLVYTKDDVKQIIDYAYERGVRVIPEIDMPAHTGSWAAAFKDITTCTGLHYLDESNDWSKRLAAEPGTGQLNPVLGKTYEIVEKVISEVASLFTDAWFHGGGDEPVYNCWNQDKRVTDYMKKNNATGIDLLHLFLKKELDFIHKSKKTAILWEDPVTNDHLPLSKDVIMQVWTNPVHVAVKKGYKVIASNYNFWYLDCGHGGWNGNDTSYDEQVAPKIPKSVAKALSKNNVDDNYRPQNWGGSGGDWCSPFKSWQRVYSYDMAFNLTETEALNILGGEVALWSEQTDTTTLDVRLWPRTSAAAEIMWSGRYDKNKHKRDIGDAMPRIFDWRYRLLQRGINTEALQPLWW